MTASTITVPSSVVLAEDLNETAVCRYCETEQPADSEHFFPHRASGGLHLRSRCRGCEKDYRTAKKAEAAAGTREIKPRGSRKAEALAAEAAASAAAEVAYLGAPAYAFTGYVPTPPVEETSTPDVEPDVVESPLDGPVITAELDAKVVASPKRRQRRR